MPKREGQLQRRWLRRDAVRCWRHCGRVGLGRVLGEADGLARAAWSILVLALNCGWAKLANWTKPCARGDRQSTGLMEKEAQEPCCCGRNGCTVEGQDAGGGEKRRGGDAKAKTTLILIANTLNPICTRTLIIRKLEFQYQNRPRRPHLPIPGQRVRSPHHARLFKVRQPTRHLLSSLS